MRFSELIQAIGDAHTILLRRAAQSVDTTLTVRNWIIGGYIVEYEQKGEDRAKYGDKIVRKLADALHRQRIPGASYRSLELYKRFYFDYPQIVQTVSAQFRKLKGDRFISRLIVQTPSAQSGQKLQLSSLKFHRTISGESGTMPIPSHAVPVEKLLSTLSFSHFVELLKVDNFQKRTFYEIEAIKGNWNVRELKRNIGSLLFDRISLSKDKKSFLKKLKSDSPLLPQDIIREPYMLEFLGVPEKKE